MSRSRWFLCAAGALFAALCGVNSSSAEDASGDYRAGEILVKLRPGVDAPRALGRLAGRAAQRIAPLGLERVRLPQGVSVEEALAAYRSDPDVEYAEPNYLAVKAVVRPADPLFVAGQQWALERIAAPWAWDLETGGEVVVAVLDTGIDYTHPDLAPNLWRNPGEVPGNGLDDDGNGVVDDVYGVRYRYGVVSGDPLDDDLADTHGTHVAGVIGARGDNGLGVVGVNWRVRLMAVKFLHGSAGLGDVGDAAAGIVYAVDHGAKVLNLSFTVAASPSLEGKILALEDALAYADEHGVLAVSAAGNSAADLDRARVYPASSRTPNNIAVAATTQGDALAAYSSYGAAAVHVAAPGGAQSTVAGGVVSTRGSMAIPDQGPYGYLSGTSIAAPHVSGLAALVWAFRPGLGHHQVKARILNGADPVPELDGKVVSGARVNTYRSLTVQDMACVFDASPQRLNPGDTLVVSGVNFGSEPGQVALDSVPLETLAWEDGRIEVRVAQEAASGRVRVNGEGLDFPVQVNRGPAVRLEVDRSEGHVPFEVHVLADASDPDGAVAVYEWDLGDGRLVERGGVTDSVSVTLTSPGTHVLRVRVWDDEGMPAQAEAAVVATEEGKGGCFVAALPVWFRHPGR